MLIALHGLALRKASDAISPLNAVVEPGCCRTPPPSSRRQRRAPRARARGIGAIKVNAEAPSTQLLNRGAVAHHPLARAASAAPLARAREELAP